MAPNTSPAHDGTPVPIQRDLSFVSDGHRLTYDIYGEGPRTLVYIHGLLLDANLNHRLAVAAAETGNRVVLIELPGHGRSDKPRRASAHRMDSYASHVVNLLDHLEVDRAVVGGVSLGANVSLFVGAHAPDRVRALIVEMPVLEMAVPGAALVFLPLLFGVHYAGRVLRVAGAPIRLIPPTGWWQVDALRATVVLDPDEMAAVLHGLLVGPIAPTVEERMAMDMPVLVIGHRSDIIHPFSDATALVRQLHDARLVQARSILELRVLPARLTTEIVTFLDEVWQPAAVGAAPSTQTG